MWEISNNEINRLLCLSQAVWYRASALFTLLLRPLFREIVTSIFPNSTLLSKNELSFYSDAIPRGEVHTLVSGRYQKTISPCLAAFLPYNWMVHASERVTLKLKSSVREKKENSHYKNSLTILLLFPSWFCIIHAGFSSPGGKWNFLLSGDGVAGWPCPGKYF